MCISDRITITFENTESKPVDKSVDHESISTNTVPANLVTALCPYGSISVSYTHLDVYKRQLAGIVSERLNSEVGIFQRSPPVLKDRYESLLQLLTLFLLYTSRCV